MTAAILVPVLRRPHRVAPLIESVRATTSSPHRLLFIGSPGDVDEHQAVVDAGAELLVIDTPCGPGDWARKINAGIAATDEPHVFLGADDLRFHEGWYEAAAAMLAGDVGVVGTNDLGNPRVTAGFHATHSLVARWYADVGHVDGPGLLHEGYDHNFVDNELAETAKARRAWAFARASIVEHLHPSWDKAAWDDVYERGRAGFERDRQLFMRRRRQWRGKRLAMPTRSR